MLDRLFDVGDDGRTAEVQVKFAEDFAVVRVTKCGVLPVPLAQGVDVRIAEG